MTVANETMQWLEKLKQADLERKNISDKRKAKELINATRAKKKANVVKVIPQVRPEKIILPREKSSRELTRDEQMRIYEQNRKAGFVYLMRSGNGYYKIGISKNIKNRLDGLKRQFPIEIEVIHQITCHDYRKVEKVLHEKYSSKRAEHEWFRLNAEDVQWIISLSNYQLG